MIETVVPLESADTVVIVTIDDSADSRSRREEIVAFGRDGGPDVVVAPAPADAYRALVAAEPDVVLVAGWYRIIPPAVLEAIPRGFFGVHYSMLPAYRGSAPVVWAMINGEPQIGFSIFQMSPGMDEGLIAGQGSVAVTSDMYVADVLEALDAASMEFVGAIAAELATGSRPLVPQSDVGLSFAGARNPADGAIDWTRTAQEVERFVRAQSRPYPGAHSVLGDATVTVWRARADREARYYGIPGQVIRILDGKAVVACGGSSGLVIEEYESPAGELRFSLLSSRFG